MEEGEGFLQDRFGDAAVKGFGYGACDAGLVSASPPSDRQAYGAFKIAGVKGNDRLGTLLGVESKEYVGRISSVVRFKS